MNKMNMNKKMDNLKTIRLSKHFTRKDLALLSGVNTMTIESLELGLTNIDNVKLSTLIALSKALKCKVADIVNNDLKKYIR